MFKLIKSEARQTTLAKEITIRGISAAGKSPCEVKLVPAKADSGIQFITSGGSVKAAIKNVVDSKSDEDTTMLKNSKTEVRSAEHIISAIWGMGIDNVTIDLTHDDIPFLSSYSYEYALAIFNTGIRELEAPRNYLTPNSIYAFKDRNSDGYAVIKPVTATIPRVDATIYFENLLGYQNYDLSLTPNNYLIEISQARSFISSPLDHKGKKWRSLRALYPTISHEQSQSPIILFDHEKYITPLKTPDEPVRHRILDFVGDISLLGTRILADLYLYKPGHRFTHELVRDIGRKITSE